MRRPKARRRRRPPTPSTPASHRQHRRPPPTTLKIGGKARTGKHYLASEKSAGVKIGLKDWCPAPEVLDKIEARIDGAAGASRWIGAGGKKNTNPANQRPNPWRE